MDRSSAQIGRSFYSSMRTSVCEGAIADENRFDCRAFEFV